MYKKTRSGFTLIELLMVISIITLISSMFFTYVGSIRAKSRDSVRLSDMKQIGTAANLYYEDKGILPEDINTLVSTGYLSAEPTDPKTGQPYSSKIIDSNGKSIAFVAYATYETQTLAGSSTAQQVGTVTGDISMEVLCASGGNYPNCTSSDSNDQIIGVTTGHRSGSSSVIETPVSVSSCVIADINKACPPTPPYITNCYCGGGLTNINAGILPQAECKAEYHLYWDQTISTCVNEASCITSGKVWDESKTVKCDVVSDNAEMVDSDGDGYYEAHNCTQLQKMKDNLSRNYELFNDIDCSVTSSWNSGAGFVPVGPFTGNFNGNSHTISNLKINLPSSTDVGLFSSATGDISNVGLVSANVTGQNNVGGLVGSKTGGTISNSYLTGTVYGNQKTGGLVGLSTGGTISNSYTTGSVLGVAFVSGGKTYGSSYLGGLVGIKSDGSISSSHSSSVITASFVSKNNYGLYNGGLVGNFDNGTVNYSYASGNVTGNAYSGGLVGQFNGIINNSYSTGNVIGGVSGNGGFIGTLSSGTINNSYSTGNTNGVNTAGGFIGTLSSGTINNSYSTGNVTVPDGGGGSFIFTFSSGTLTNCYSTGKVTSFYSTDFVGSKGAGATISQTYFDLTTSGRVSTSIAGVIGTTTVAMKNQATYTGWDFANIWQITSGDYPRLR